MEDAKTSRRAVVIARVIFILAAVYGLPVMASWFVVEPALVRKARGQQPEIYYGFAAVVIAWQVAFVLIAVDPRRYRPLMLIAAVFEKFGFSAILALLMLRGRAGLHWIAPAVIDGLLGVGFTIAWAITPKMDFGLQAPRSAPLSDAPPPGAAS